MPGACLIKPGTSQTKKTIDLNANSARHENETETMKIAWMVFRFLLFVYTSSFLTHLFIDQLPPLILVVVFTANVYTSLDGCA